MLAVFPSTSQSKGIFIPKIIKSVRKQLAMYKTLFVYIPRVSSEFQFNEQIEV